MECANPMLAMALSTGVAPPSSSNALAVGLWDAQQLSAGGPAPMNPLLLASACFGSSGALNFLFSREDAQMPPLIMPTQEFLDLLTPVSSTRKRLTVPQTCGDVEDGVDLSCLLATTLLLKGVTPQGDNALHVVVSHGDNSEFLKCASIIDKRDQDLLFAVNRKGDTPLHCAVRAGKSQMLTCLIELAESCNRLPELIRKENALKETALHYAIRIGNKNIVECLLKADPDLANYPKPKLGNDLREGTSPLYLAISLKRDIIAWTLHDKSNGNLSYHGPNGRNALHAAILQGIVVTAVLLKVNNSLTTQGDRDGSTPLHFASSLRCRLHQPFEDYDFSIRMLWHSNIFREVFEANPAPVYQADNNGLFPIHIAASLGVKATVGIILEKCPSSAGLLTAQGQTFLHVAVEKRRFNIVSFVCRTPSLAWILNMQDNDGNTALHLAVKDSRLGIFCSLYGNMDVHLSLTNNNEETPSDLSKCNLPRGMYYYLLNSKWWIYEALEYFHTNDHSGLRWDQYEESYSRQLTAEELVKETEKAKDSSQILGICSVLIATVAFGATFAVPGGFIADDHANRGTPTLARRYTFDAFMMANALAFICSSIVTIGLMFSGSSMNNLVSRRMHLGASMYFMASSFTSLSAAFALGVYMFLAPVAHATAIVICVFTPLVVLYRNFEFLLKFGIFARALYIRMGLCQALFLVAPMMGSRLLAELWPFLLIFGWAAIAQKLRNDS